MVRRVQIGIKYNNKNISEDIQPFLKAITYTEVMSNEADNIELTVQNVNELWNGEWLPDKGAILDVFIKICSTNSLSLGKFEIDEISMNYPPSEVTIKAISVPYNTNLRAVAHYKAWEKIRFSICAKEIAKKANMKLFFDVKNDVFLERAEQVEESDLAFLRQVCGDHGLALKVSDEKIVIFKEKDYEKKDAKTTITKIGSNIINFSITSKIRNIYRACHVKYQDSKTGKVIEATFTDSSKKEGKILQVNEQVKNIAAAESLAKSRLRSSNKNELVGHFTFVGTFKYFSGNVVELRGFRKFDGRYIITKVTHAIDSSGYVTSIDCRRCLNGY